MKPRTKFNPKRRLIFLVALVSCASLPDRKTYWLADCQSPDGMWTASGGRVETEDAVRVTALATLATIGDIRADDQSIPECAELRLLVDAERRSVRRGVQWMLSRQDAGGRFGYRSDAPWILDQAMATYALVEAYWVKGMDVPLGAILLAVEGLRVHVAKSSEVVSTETRLWGDLIVLSLRIGARARSVAVEAGDGLACRKAAERLEATLRELPHVLPSTRRELAARRMRAALAGPDIDDDAETGWVDAPLEDPLVSFYSFAAVWLCRPREFMNVNDKLSSVLLRCEQERRTWPHGGYWDAVPGEFAGKYGRTGTTALAILLSEVSHSICWLSFPNVD